METVYLETTIFSYLTARLSRHVVVAGHQQTTLDWWTTRRQEFLCVISDFVLLEVGRGDAQQATERVKLTNGLVTLATTPAVLRLAEQLLVAGAFPSNADGDALHLALALTGRVDYLMTWNCAHLANARLIGKMQAVAEQAGWRLPVICTPDELMGESYR